MASVAAPDALSPRRTMRRIVLKATRPALSDLRFKGEPDVIADGGGAAVRLGRYTLTNVACTALDVASLARTFCGVRTGQARRVVSRGS